MQGVQHVQGFSSYNNKSLKSLIVQITLHTLQPCIKLNKHGSALARAPKW
jgi:hypothetical protein